MLFVLPISTGQFDALAGNYWEVLSEINSVIQRQAQKLSILLDTFSGSYWNVLSTINVLLQKASEQVPFIFGGSPLEINLVRPSESVLAFSNEGEKYQVQLTFLIMQYFWYVLPISTIICTFINSVAFKHHVYLTQERIMGNCGFLGRKEVNIKVSKIASATLEGIFFKVLIVEIDGVNNPARLGPLINAELMRNKIHELVNEHKKLAKRKESRMFRIV